jgi:hypothetical protein
MRVIAVKPLLHDVKGRGKDGVGIEIIELQETSDYRSGEDGLQHRSAWAMGCCFMARTATARSAIGGRMCSPTGRWGPKYHIREALLHKSHEGFIL